MLAISDQAFLANTSQANAALYNATILYGLDFVLVGLTTLPPLPGFQELIAPPKAQVYRKALLYNGSIVGALMLGERSQGMAFKRAIDHRVNLAPVAGQLFQESFDFNAWLTEQGVPDPLLGEAQVPAFKTSGRTQNISTASAQADAHHLPQASMQDADAYFAPIPHSKVTVSLKETRIAFSDQKQKMTIGRQGGVSWCIEHHSVSRLHAEVTYEGGAYWLRDAGSSKGTFVNGVLQTSTKPYRTDPSISRHHAEIVSTPDGFSIRDLNSSYALLRRGEFLGEDGMLTGLPYKFSARARGPALLLHIPEQAMQRLRELVPSLRRYFEDVAQECSLHTISSQSGIDGRVARCATRGNLGDGLCTVLPSQPSFLFRQTRCLHPIACS